MSAPAVARGSANFAAANANRTRAAGERDRNLARLILDDGRLAGAPERWVQVAHERAAQPEDASWAEIAAALGLTKCQVTGTWRRLTQTLGYMPWSPSELERRRSARGAS